MIYVNSCRDDGKPGHNAYVEQSTLLEPNNFIASWVYLLISIIFQEGGGEEKKEVSTTLRKLRVKYDTIGKLVKEKERELEDLKVNRFFHFFPEKAGQQERGGVQV